MRALLKFTFFSLLVFGFVACGQSGPSEADVQAEAEADQLDSTTQVIEEAIDAVQVETADLEAALDSLDALFPEEEQ